MEKKNIIATVVGVGLSLLAVYGIAYFASKGWQKGQEKK